MVDISANRGGVNRKCTNVTIHMMGLLKNPGGMANGNPFEIDMCIVS